MAASEAARVAGPRAKCAAARRLEEYDGRTMDLGEAGAIVRVGGLGGCYGPSDFERPSKHLQGYARRHYTRDEIETLSAAPSVDVVLVHDAPAGIRFATHRHGSGSVSEAKGLDLLISRLRPLVCFFGHHHIRLDGEVAGIQCIGLNRVHMPGNLVAIDVDRRGRQWSIVGEWPARRSEGTS